MKGKVKNPDEAYQAGRIAYIASIKSDIRYWENMLKSGMCPWGEKLCEIKIENIHKSLEKLYAKLTDEKEIDHQGRKNMYYWKKKLPHKDNSGDYVVFGDVSRWSKLRVPSLKRKNAWKRFYKMFPGLKGKKVITGYSSTYAVPDLHSSTIKLKN